MSAAAYVSTSFTDISRTLAGMFSNFGGGGAAQGRENFLRAAHRNTVFLLSSPSHTSATDDIIQKLAIIHPSRFFVLVTNSDAETPRAEVCAQCHLIPGAAGNKPEHLCSEVIRVHFKKEDLRKIPAILRANFVTGAPVEFFFPDAKISPEAATSFLTLADQIYFNSANFEAAPDLLSKIVEAGIPVVDTQWLGTAAWRDQVRSVFEAAALPALARGISKVEISYIPVEKNQKPFLPFLFAGWFVDRLGLEVLGRSGESYDCEAPHGGRVRLSISTQELEEELPASSGRSAVLSAISIAGIVRGGKEVQIRIERKIGSDGFPQLDTAVRTEKPFRLSRALDEELESELLGRFFMIGESIINYRAALSKGLLLKEFQKSS